MPKIFKRLSRPETSEYVFQPAADLLPDAPGAGTEESTAPEKPAEPDPEATPEERELHYARIQADAIIEDARREAEAYRAESLQAVEDELQRLRDAARQEGYGQGYAAGMADAAEEGKRQREEMAAEQIRSVELFLEAAARERDRMLDNSREELKDLAIAIAEKVIRVSLKNSSDILLRMVDAATDTHKRCEWAHIYVADCDLQGKAYTAPELAAALGHVSNRIRVVPMADDESGTCIVELPDVILDASVSTQLDSIREVLDGTTLDRDE